MTNPIYKTLGKVVELSLQTNKFGEYPIQYTQPNYQDTAKVWNHAAPEDKLSEAATEKLASLKVGDLFCAHIQKDENGFPKIVDITDAKDAEKKDTNGQTFFKKKVFTPKDETGVAVGAAWTNALDYIRTSGGFPEKLIGTANEEDYLDVVDKLAWSILQRKLKHEDKLRAQRKTTTNSETKSEEVKPLSKAELLKLAKAKSTKAIVTEVQEDLIEPDLDGVSFDD